MLFSEEGGGWLESESDAVVTAFFFFSFFSPHTLKLTYASGGRLVSGIPLTNKQNGQLTCSSVQPERRQRCTRLFFMDLSVQIDLTFGGAIRFCANFRRPKLH